MPNPMPTPPTPEIVDLEDLRTNGTRLFEGADHGGVALSFFVVDGRPGGGPARHRHPYAEVFLVLEGLATFEVEGRDLHAHGGQIVIAPPDQMHRFRNTGDGPLRMVTLHPGARVETEWDEAGATR